MQRVAIVHFLPVEQYPPVMNLLDDWSDIPNLKLYLYSTKNKNKFGEYKNTHVFSTRINQFSTKWLPFNGILNYLWFNLFTFVKLVFANPTHVLYYESYSAYPVYLYLRLLGRNKKVWMHSHEYFSPEWYKQGMLTVKYYHRLEKKFLYPKAIGLSQTNEFRNVFFHEDHPTLSKEKLYSFPNFPPRSWQKHQRCINRIESPIKIVYIGSLSLRATHIKSFCEWVITQQGTVQFDIFTYNLDLETKVYLTNLNVSFINLFDQGIPYHDIPEKLSNERYSVGVILYKGLYKNTAWCASNKLFEYLICGLDVWFTADMPGTDPYITDLSYPKVIKTDFGNMAMFDLEKAISHQNLVYRPFTFCSSDVSQTLYKSFVQR